MAQIKSQKKRIITNEKSHLRNASYKSSMRTASKKVVVACNTADKELAALKLNEAYSMIDKSVSKGIQTKKTAARQKAHLAKLVYSVK